MAAFDPDAYIKKNEPKTEFDPDSYIADGEKKTNAQKFAEPFKDVSAQDFAKNSLLGSAANYLFQKSPVGKLLPNTLASIAPVSPEQRQRIQGLDQPATAGNIMEYAALGGPVNRALQGEARENVMNAYGNAAQGAYTAVTNPVETAKGLYEHATTNPYGFAGELAKGALYDPELLGKPGARAIEMGAATVAAPVTVPYKLAQGVLNVGRGELGGEASALRAISPEQTSILNRAESAVNPNSNINPNMNALQATLANAAGAIPKEGQMFKAIGESIARGYQGKGAGMNALVDLAGLGVGGVPLSSTLRAGGAVFNTLFNKNAFKKLAEYERIQEIIKKAKE
jgi:hypothetical protein